MNRGKCWEEESRGEGKIYRDKDKKRRKGQGKGGGIGVGRQEYSAEKGEMRINGGVSRGRYGGRR